MMAMKPSSTRTAYTAKEPQGTPQEQAELEQSYKHLCTLRDEVISLGVLPRQRVARTQPPISSKTVYTVLHTSMQSGRAIARPLSLYSCQPGPPACA